MLPWLALTFTAARLGFEAQNAAAFRLMRLGIRPETAAGEIIPHAVALPRRLRHSRKPHQKSVRPRRLPRSQRRPSGNASGQRDADRPPETARQLGLTERRKAPLGRPLEPSPPGPEKQRRHSSAASRGGGSPRPAHAWLNSTMIGIQTLVTEIEASGGAAGGTAYGIYPNVR